MTALQHAVASPRHHQSFFRFLHRVVATGSVALTLLLTILAASPQLHQHLHDSHGDADVAADDSCAVVLFGDGVSLATGSPEVPEAPASWHEQSARANTDVFVTRPRYLHRPERGPPSS
jgi:hypothetical protein